MTLFGLATYCVTQNIIFESEYKFWLVNGRLNYYALRIGYCVLEKVVNWNDMDLDDLYSIGYLDSMIGRLKEAEEIYMRALKGYEKV